MNSHEAMRARISARLRERRRALGITQAQCAVLIGMSRLSLTRLELGYRRLKLSELAIVCAALGCPAEDLLGDPPSPRSQCEMRTVFMRGCRLADAARGVRCETLPP